MMRITARLIGSVEIRDADGSELDTLPSQPKRFGLLSYLLTAQPRGFHRRDKLLGLFWPEASQDQARHSLSQALHVLRGELGEGTIRSRGDGDVAIDEAAISCDAIEFELAVDASAYEKALELYRGDFLEGWFIREAPEFERWLEGERIRLREKAAGAAWCLAHEHLTEDRLVDAERIAQRALLLVATDESEVRRFIQALADAGDRAAAVRFYERFTQRLRAEYEIEPDPVTVECAQRIRNKKSSADRDSVGQGYPQAGHTAQVTPSTVRPVVAGRPRLRAWVWGAAITVLAAVGTAIGMLATWDRGPQAVMPQPVQRQLTHDGNVDFAALSPDGQYLAYLITASPAKVMVQDLVGGTKLVVADSMGLVLDMRWSPDGTRLSVAGEYGGELGINLFPRLGGRPQRVQYASRLAWSPDATRMATWWGNVESAVRVRDLRSDNTYSLPIPGTREFVRGGDWSPRGDLLALSTCSGPGPSSLWVLDLGTGTHVLTQADSACLDTPRWAPTGDAIYYLRDDNLYRIGVDPNSGRAEGPARRIVTLEGVEGAAEGYGSVYALSGDGRKLAYRRTSGYTNFSISRVAAGGDIQQVRLTTGTADKGCPTLSPDGTSLAFLQESGDGFDLYRVTTGGGTPDQLTFGGSADYVCPVWAPSGRWLAFATRIGGTRKVAIVGARGGTARIFKNTDVSWEIAWFPSLRIAYQEPGNRNFRLLDPETEEAQLLVRDDSVGWMFALQLSPDGTRAAICWNKGWNKAGGGLWLISLVDSSRVRLVEAQVYPIGWSVDGQSVYARDVEGVIKRYPLIGGEGVVVPHPDLGDTHCTPYERPEGLVWVCSAAVSFSDVWMIENFDPEMAGRSR